MGVYEVNADEIVCTTFKLNQANLCVYLVSEFMLSSVQ
jgi:hypothetical protein